MYVASTAKRYFDLTIETERGEDIVLALKPPSVSALTELTSLAEAATAGKNVFGVLRGSVADMLRRNKNGVEVPDEIIDDLDYDQLIGILQAFLIWVREERAKN